MRPEDRAQQLELIEWEARQKAAIQPEPTMESAKYCQISDCGKRIPARRRKAIPGVQFCIECQERIERVKGRYARAD